MKFKPCINCKYNDYSIANCVLICALPNDILKCVENYFNDDRYPEDLEMDLFEIEDKGMKKE